METNPVGASEPNQGRQTRLGEGEEASSLTIKLKVPEKEEEEEETKRKMRLQHSISPPKPNRTGKLPFSQPIRHLDVAEAAFQRWRQIGVAVGLSDDSDIASFLMWHYEATPAASPTSTLCSSCQAPLVLTCVACRPSPTSAHRSLPPSACGVLSQSGGDDDDDDDDDGGGGEVSWKGQDAVGVCGVDMVDLGVEDEQEDVLQDASKRTVPRTGTDHQKRKCNSPWPGPPPPPPPPPPLPPPCAERPEQPRKKRQPGRSSERKPSKPVGAETFPRPPGSVGGHRETHKERGKSGVGKLPSSSSSPQQGIRVKRATQPDPASKLVTAAKESDVQGKQPRHACGECGASFSRAGGLKVHMRIHTGEKPYKCQQCPQAFNQSVGLIAHQRKHTGERPYVCAECGASFPLASTLNQHGRIHSGERPFRCPHCHRAFCRSGDLTSHLRVHTGLRPFLCPDCGKRFASSSDLTKHKRTHSGDRPFPCPQCPKRFPFPHRLAVHMRRHTGDRPFLCPVCGAGFARASNLTVHSRTHTGDKPFECGECGKRFSDSANLCKHRRNNSHRQSGQKARQT